MIIKWPSQFAKLVNANSLYTTSNVENGKNVTNIEQIGCKIKKERQKEGWEGEPQRAKIYVTVGSDFV